MIILSIGSNLPSRWGNRVQTLNTAILKLKTHRINVIKQSSPYFSAPMPLANKDVNSKNNITIDNGTAKTADDYGLPDLDYININLIVETTKTPTQLLYCLKQIEHDAGRNAGKRWASRPLDMDIIDYKGVILGNDVEYNQRNHAGFLPLSLPHPGLTKRIFVLKPLHEIAPFWHHPQSGKTAAQLIHTLK